MRPGFDSPVLWQIQGLPAFIATGGGQTSSSTPLLSEPMGYSGS